MIIAVSNGKGGTGKTTLATALAGEAAHRGQRVLVVDLDVQANATEHLIGVGDPLRKPQGDAGRALYRAIMDGDAISAIGSPSGIDLLPAGARTQTLADELQRLASTSNEALGRSLASLRSALHEQTAGYDLVVLDTPPSEQSHALLDTFLVAADAVIIPTKISAADISGAVKLLQRLAALDRLGTPYAEPLGAALMAVPSGAKRLLAHAERELEPFLIRQATARARATKHEKSGLFRLTRPGAGALPAVRGMVTKPLIRGVRHDRTDHVSGDRFSAFDPVGAGGGSAGA